MGMDHYCLACAFAVNPARKRAPTGFGVDRSALPSKERAFMPRMPNCGACRWNPTCDVLAENPVGGLGTFSHKLLDSAKLI